jgi:chorismate mutase
LHTDLSGKLDEIAAELASMEETIIFHLLARAQHRFYPAAFGGSASGLDARLERQDRLEAELGRFMVAEERPFSKLADKSGFMDERFPIDDLDQVNLTVQLRTAYLDFLPLLCFQSGIEGEREALERDITTLKILSRRVHYGSFYVAEAKYQADPAGFRRMIAEGDREGILRLITRPEVESRVLERVLRKTSALQNGARPPFLRPVEPTLPVVFFREAIIPLTKKGEMAYLFARRA